MSKEEFLALAAQRYDSIESLQKETDFFSYEEQFEKIWIELGQVVLEKSISEVPQNHQKKTKFKAVSGKSR
ncbi:MAG: hypothetical protein MUE85_22705 [Microscillaceae bacterium]|jgi:hypothetical protein|nr:hypothetical protein [Microscillaceae bacterium]